MRRAIAPSGLRLQRPFASRTSSRGAPDPQVTAPLSVSNITPHGGTYPSWTRRARRRTHRARLRPLMCAASRRSSRRRPRSRRESTSSAGAIAGSFPGCHPRDPRAFGALRRRRHMEEGLRGLFERSLCPVLVVLTCIQNTLGRRGLLVQPPCQGCPPCFPTSCFRACTPAQDGPELAAYDVGERQAADDAFGLSHIAFPLLRRAYSAGSAAAPHARAAGGSAACPNAPAHRTANRVHPAAIRSRTLATPI